MAASREKQCRVPLETIETLPDGPFEASHAPLTLHSFHVVWIARPPLLDKRNPCPKKRHHPSLPRPPPDQANGVQPQPGRSKVTVEVAALPNQQGDFLRTHTSVDLLKFLQPG